MSLLEQYNNLKSLKGFTLGYYKFFDSFSLILRTIDKKFSFKWNTIKLAQGSYWYLEAPRWEIPPCICDPNPLAMHIGPCSKCGKEPKMAPEKIQYQCEWPSRDGKFILDLNEFVNQQKDWINTEDIQKQYKNSRRQLKEECQQRVNFFVAELHKEFMGKVNINHYQLRGTLDRNIGDIRHFAMMCLKE